MQGRLAVATLERRPESDPSSPGSRSTIEAAEPVRVVATVVGPPLAAELVVAALGLDGTGALCVRLLGWGLAVGAVLAAVVRPLVGALARTRLQAEDAEAALDSAHAEVGFRARFERGLAQTDSEPAAIRAALRAAAELVPDSDPSLLLAVPDQTKVGWSVRVLDNELQPARPIPGLPSCGALTEGVTVSTSTSSLDACSHLSDPDMEVSTTCIPLRLDDRILGVVSILQAPGESPDGHTLGLLEWVVERTGFRISEQRRLKGRSTASREDDVTGLPGARTLDHFLRDSVRSLVPFCVAMVDLDEYAGLRHAHGDQVADDSLRMLADTLRITLRPEDLVCRLKDGRFAVVLGNCGATHASMALERVREALTLTLTLETGPQFTFSAGIVESHRATSIEDLMEQARTAAALSARQWR